MEYTFLLLLPLQNLRYGFIVRHDGFYGVRRMGDHLYGISDVILPGSSPLSVRAAITCE